MRRKNPKKRTQYTEAKKRILAITKKKRIGPTMAQRRSVRKTMKKLLGYESPRLSMAVGRRMPDGTIKPGKASRYRVKGKQLIHETKMVYFEPEYKSEPIPRERRTLWGPAEREVLVKPGGMRTVKGVITGERLIVKKVRKGKTGMKGSSRGEGPVRVGSAASVRQRTKKAGHKRAAKRGKKSKREKRKKKR